MCDIESQVWCSADSCLFFSLPILKVCPARIPGSHSWVIDVACHSWWEKEKDETLKRRESRLHTFSRFSCTNATRMDIARNGASLSVLPPLTFSRERTSKLKIWHLDRWLKLIAHICYFCQHGVLDQAVACAYFYRSWAQTQLLNKHFFWGRINSHNRATGYWTALVADPRDGCSNSYSIFQAEEILDLFSTNSWFHSKTVIPKPTLCHTIYKRNPFWLL